jgi:AcrR family transcriptional regulator
MSPRSAEQNQAIREARHEEILAAARAEFSEHGYLATTTDAVAARAGVSKGLLFRYFPTREELFRASFDAALDDLFGPLFEAMREPEPAAAIRGVIRVAVSPGPVAAETASLLSQVASTPDLRAVTAARLESTYRDVIDRLAKLFGRLGTPYPRGSAAVLVAAMDGLAQQRRVLPEMVARPRILGALLRGFALGEEG